jgi:hypothetical protein
MWQSQAPAGAWSLGPAEPAEFGISPVCVAIVPPFATPWMPAVIDDALAQDDAIGRSGGSMMMH